MNAQELLKSWPGIEKANAETVLASPAWRLETEYAGSPAEIRRDVSPASDETLDIAITLDDVPHCLRLADSEAFADLHQLWVRRTALPNELLLALVERECGPLLQTLENAARRQLSVKGIAPAGTAPSGELPMLLTAAGVSVRFALDLDPALAVEWGRLDNLDVTHASIRGLTRPVRLKFASFDLTEAELAEIRSGASVVLGEEEPSWRLVGETDDLLRIVSEREGSVTFAQMCDDTWPEVPAEPDPSVLLVHAGAVVAKGTLSTLGLCRAVRVD